MDLQYDQNVHTRTPILIGLHSPTKLAGACTTLSQPTPFSFTLFNKKFMCRPNMKIGQLYSFDVRGTFKIGTLRICTPSMF